MPSASHLSLGCQSRACACRPHPNPSLIPRLTSPWSKFYDVSKSDRVTIQNACARPGSVRMRTEWWLFPDHFVLTRERLCRREHLTFIRDLLELIFPPKRLSRLAGPRGLPLGLLKLHQVQGLSAGLQRQRTASGASPAGRGCWERGRGASQGPGEQRVWEKTRVSGHLSARLTRASSAPGMWLSACDWPTSFSCGQVCNNTDSDSGSARVEKKCRPIDFYGGPETLKNVIEDVAQSALNILLGGGRAKAQTEGAASGGHPRPPPPVNPLCAALSKNGAASRNTGSGRFSCPRLGAEIKAKLAPLILFEKPGSPLCSRRTLPRPGGCGGVTAHVSGAETLGLLQAGLARLCGEERATVTASRRRDVCLGTPLPAGSPGRPCRRHTAGF